MLLLLVDTAGPTGGVLLAQTNESAFERDHSIVPKMEILGEVGLHPRAFSAELIPAIAELLRGSERRLTDLDAFAVVAGPGSFTGLRVGLSAVKAMAEATGKPILTVSHLAIMASVAAQVAAPDRAGPADQAMHVLLNAGRGEFYHGCYRDAGRTRLGESFETFDSLTESLRESPGLIVVMEPTMKSGLPSIDGLSFCEISPPTVQDALPLAVQEWRAGHFHDPASVDANYLRRSDAVVVVRPKAGAIKQVAQSQEATS